jgi:RND family efflux transporter MFP subunit
MNRKLLIRILVPVAVVAVVIVVTQVLKSRNEVTEPEPPIRPVKTMVVEDTPAQFRRIFSGRLEASQTVDLAFLTSGDLVELPVNEGDRLEKGELIARLDARDARSRFDAARADMVLAETELSRSKTLFEEQLIAASEFEGARRSFEVALASFETATKAVEDTEMRAPFAGIVARINVDNFQKVQAGQVIATFFNPEGFDIVIDLPETVVTLIPHYTAKLTAQFEQAPERLFPLEIKEFATVADTYTKSYPLTLSMERPADLLILPNMTVSVNVDFTRKAEILDEQYLVPVTAIVYDVQEDASVVWILDDTTMTVNPRPVEIERGQGGEVVIRSGLKAGDIVVTAGGSFLNRDQKVRFFEG